VSIYGAGSRGEEILVCDRSVPVGKLVPLSTAEEFDAEELELAAAGVLRLPTDARSATRRTGRGGYVDPDRILEALDCDRDE
jgi:antitoxin (DNA-binding transcriptional repressor) of toxin-antitoxin stability system